MTQRLVVIGNGMVGSRFVDELTTADHDQQFQVIMLGAEEYKPYNRVLLSEVVAGKVDLASLTLPTPRGQRVDVLRGTTAVRIDREAQVVHTNDGGRHDFDYLVLATGSTARIPELPGLKASRPDDPEALSAGVHPLRTLDDAREIVAATVNADSAVVIGAGILGIEVACGLVQRGLNVTVIHGRETPMERSLDHESGQVLAQTLSRLGISQRFGALTEQMVLRDGRLIGVRLTSGEPIDADLLVLACGTTPDVELARNAALRVDRGILVGDDLATDDERIFAIGDCAQPAEGSSGLVAQGWEQAHRLTAILTRRTSARERRPAAATDVVRLKAAGLEVVAMGVCGSQREQRRGHRTIKLGDAEAGRYLEIVIADGVLVGATCVGSATVGADLVFCYLRRTPVPADPAQLLIRSFASVATPATSPTHIPDRATICNCNGVTKRNIVDCWQGGAQSVDEVATATRATTGCGTCTNAVCGILDWLASVDPPSSAESSHLSAADGEQGVTTGKQHVHSVETPAG